MKRMLIYLLFALLANAIALSCGKDDFAEEYSAKEDSLAQGLEAGSALDRQLFAESSEVIIEGVLFIDGISQEEEIVDFDLDGVSVVDGRLTFTDIDAFLSALVELAAHNEESIAAWSSRIGFISLFTEFLRIEGLSSAMEMAGALQANGLYADYFNITGEGILELAKHSMVLASIVNPNGLLQAGNYIGAFYPGLNVWVPAGHEKALLKALKTKEIPEGDEAFLVTDDRAFMLGRDVVFPEDCPKVGSWLSLVRRIHNPDNNRMIDVRNFWSSFAFPTGDEGLWDTAYAYGIQSTSRRGAFNRRYKTDHYLSLDITVGQFALPNQNPISTFEVAATGTANNRKTAILELILPGHRGVTEEFLLSNPRGVIETQSGDLNSGQTGTSASHRGMGGLYVRQQCD